MSCGRAGGAARALRSPSPSWSPASPGPGSGTADEWPSKWARLGAATVNHRTAGGASTGGGGRAGARTPGGTGILRAEGSVGIAPSAPARPPSAHLSGDKKKKPFPGKKPPSWQILAALPPPLSRSTRCLSHLSLLTYIFYFFLLLPGAFREASGSPRIAWGVPTVPSMGRGPFTRRPSPAEPIPPAQAPS